MDGNVAAFEPAKEHWPPNYTEVFAQRIRRLKVLRSNVKGAKEFYRTHAEEFIEHWGMTFDPRNAADPTKISYLPFVPFSKQRLFVKFLLACIEQQADGLVEKCRDMGATWICVAMSVWIWLFMPGSAVGWGSRKQELVDRLGDASSIFEKIRIFIRQLPKEFLPKGFDVNVHMPFMKIINPETGSVITGEVGDNIGRGGRSLIYFKDESAHYERPELIEAALGDNTNIQIDISSVNGLGNVFHRRRKAGKLWNPDEPMSKTSSNVFVMDWKDHPAKDQEWYNNRRAKAEGAGLLHKFAQEVERNYAAAVSGVIIPLEWIQAAEDAHVKLGLAEAELGPWGGGLDVADNDGSGDANGLVLRKGIVIKSADQWGERDTGTTTRRAIKNCEGLGRLELQYDVCGLGSGVKAEYNRLKDEQAQSGKQVIPKGLQLTPWDAGRGCLNPKQRLLTLPNGDPDLESPKQEDFYYNLKAQGWWELRGRFERTWRALNEPGFTYEPASLISISSAIPSHILYKLMEELAQPTAGYAKDLRMVVNKQPDGTPSPNLGDAAMMAFWPVPLPAAPEALFGVYSAA